MTIAVKHNKVATTPDDGASEVGSDEWNAAHDLTLANNKLVGNASGSAGAAQEIDMVGMQMGYAYTQSSTVASTSDATIPGDDTIPQSSEGVAYPSLDTTYTPKYADSLLEIDVFIPFVSAQAAAALRFSLMRDSGTDAIYATTATVGTGNAVPVSFRVVVAAGSTSATTFKLRWCTSTSTAYLMRTSTTAAFFSTADTAVMTVKEIKQ